MGRLGFSEILVILVVALLLFGAGRIADIGKGLGEGIKNFKKGIKDGDDVKVTVDNETNTLALNGVPAQMKKAAMN